MPKVTFVEHTGTEHQIEGSAGTSLMQVALANGVPGILADCGGSASCGTCHILVRAQWAERLPAPNPAEAAMLEGFLDPQPTSRLSCQLTLTEELDGLVVDLPENQG